MSDGHQNIYFMHIFCLGYNLLSKAIELLLLQEFLG